MAHARLRTIGWLACGVLIAGPGVANGKAKPQAGANLESAPARELAMPPEHQSLLTLAPDIGAVTREGAQVIVLPRSETWGSTATFDPLGATRDAVFGKISAMERQSIYQAEAPDHAWVGVDAGANGGRSLLLLDGVHFILFQSDPKSWKEVLRRTVAWDQARPPRDRGGEGTTPETAALRARLLKAWKGTVGLKVAGMAVLPPEWNAGAANKRVYAVATRVAGFPLLLMECDLEDPSSCLVSRACNLGSGAAGSEHGAPIPDTIAGVAVDTATPKERRLLFGDRRGHRLIAYRFDSCLSAPRREAFALPAKLKELANVATDRDGGLWIATRVADDYLNASVYWWPKGSW